MLITTLRTGERIKIGETTLLLIDIRDGYGGRKARLGLEADLRIEIDRSEIRQAKLRHRREGAR